MSDIDTRFKKAVYLIRNGPKQESSNDQKLQVYGLFKQATLGDVTESAPWMPGEKKYKWEAWNKNKGMSKDDAKAAYVKLMDDGNASWEEHEVLKGMPADYCI
eukprot:TRINITY_DN114526_c0_g1_i1.p1 TRINITY_DN114526_c0_g1~~TRINITY_DN114526_c0_g1_i1.p1  ORF type:complete len:112 (-),score=21.62 TRINITY_DN114526_c0_g1_i1:264-572(-)